MSQDETSTNAEFLYIANSVFKTGNTGSNAKETTFTVGKPMPSLPSGSTDNITFSASGSSIVGSAQFWQFNQRESFEEETEAIGGNIGKTTKWSFIRSEENRGVADIHAGGTVTAKLALAVDGKSVVLAEDLEIFWTQEFVGTGKGSLPDRAKKLKSESHAVAGMNTALTLAASAGIFASLAF